MELYKDILIKIFEESEIKIVGIEKRLSFYINFLLFCADLLRFCADLLRFCADLLRFVAFLCDFINFCVWARGFSGNTKYRSSPKSLRAGLPF